METIQEKLKRLAAEKAAKNAGSNSSGSAATLPDWAGKVADMNKVTLPEGDVVGANSTRRYVMSLEVAPDRVVIDGNSTVKLYDNGLYNGVLIGMLELDMNAGAKYALPTFVLGNGDLLSVATPVEGLEIGATYILDLVQKERKGQMTMACLSCVAA